MPSAGADVSAEWLRDAIATLIGTGYLMTILATDPWSPRMLVADRYRAGRCFLLGDAAHLNPAFGGGASVAAALAGAMDRAMRPTRTAAASPARTVAGGGNLGGYGI